MVTSEIRLWPGVPDLRALGAGTFEDLIGESSGLEGASLASVRREAAGLRVLRYPLPGTVHAPGEKPSRPRGAGTGYVDLYRWTGGPWGDRLGARFKKPRSASFAAHAWNLICHLREAGVGTAEPLAMGQESSALFGRRSFLVTRALEPMQTLPDYLEENLGLEARRYLCHALGLFLRRVQKAGVELPELNVDAVYVSRRSDTKVDECAIAKIHSSLGGDQVDPSSPVPGMRTRPLPELAVSEFGCGRIHDSLSLAQRIEQLRRLAQRARVQRHFSNRDALRIARLALGPFESRHASREALRRLLEG